MSSFTVYILRTDKDTLYIGQTKDLATRLIKHRSGTGAKYLKYFKNFKLVYQEECADLSTALRREATLKKMTRPQKEKFLAGRS